jgi:6,7-dimethyl-8-ribityllumazine synthase
MADIANSKLLQVDAGILNVQDACIVLVKTEWNAPIVDELERGAISQLQKNHVKKIITVTVPGAVEIPFAIKSYWEQSGKKNKPDAFIALGCVVRGGTPHFDYVCKAVVLTVDNEEQAKERAGGKHGHKGEEAAITALKMINLRHSFKNKRKFKD